MKITTASIIFGLALSAAAAPVNQKKRQLGEGGTGCESGALPSLGGGSLPIPSNGLGGEGAGLPSGLPGVGSGSGSTGFGGEGSLPSGLPGIGSGGQGGLPSGLPGVGSGGQGSLPSGLPGIGSGSGGLPSGLPSGIFPSGGALPTGGFGGEGSGQGSLPSDLPSLGAGAGGLPSGSLPTALPAPSGSTYGSGSGLTPLNGGGLSREATDPPNEKRQDLGSLGGSGGSLPTGIPSGFGSSTGGIGSFSSLIPSSGSGLGSLGGSCGDLGSLGGGSGSLGSLGGGSGGLGSLGGGSSSGGLGSLGGGSTGLSSSAAPAESAAASSAPAPSTGSGNGYPNAPASSYSGGSTATDISDNTGCRDLTFIFARGTTEVGTMGSVVGPPTASALQKLVGANGVSVQGVDYPADAAGNANLGGSGGPTMAKLANQALQACPKTKIVLSGYSQGAMVVHNALSNGLDGSSVAAVVVFGDPLNGQSFDGVDASKTKEYCGSSDFICASGPTNGSGSHLSYGSDAQAAAEFVVQATGASA